MVNSGAVPPAPKSQMPRIAGSNLAHRVRSEFLEEDCLQCKDYLVGLWESLRCRCLPKSREWIQSDDGRGFDGRNDTRVIFLGKPMRWGRHQDCRCSDTLVRSLCLHRSSPNSVGVHCTYVVLVSLWFLLQAFEEHLKELLFNIAAPIAT